MLARLLERQTHAEGRFPTAISGLTLFRHANPTPPVNVLYEPALCVIAQGSKRVMFGGREFRYDAERYLLITADVPATARIVAASAERPYWGLRLALDPLEVGEVVAELGSRQQPSPASGALAVSTLDTLLLDAVTRLVALLDSPSDVQILAPLVRREITYRLLIGHEGQRLRQIIAGNDQGQRITHALRWLKTHYEEPLRIESLAKQAGMSPSALHHHFKAVTAAKPVAVPEASPSYGGTTSHARRIFGCGRGQLQGGLREPHTIQPGVPPTVRCASASRHRGPPQGPGAVESRAFAARQEIGQEPSRNRLTNRTLWRFRVSRMKPLIAYYSRRGLNYVSGDIVDLPWV